MFFFPDTATDACASLQGFLASIVFTDDGGAKARETYRHLATVVGRVIPGRAVCEGIHAEGPCVEDCGGLPCTRHQSMPPKVRAPTSASVWTLSHGHPSSVYHPEPRRGMCSV